MCQETSTCVVSISYGVVYGGTYVRLEWCPLGCLGRVCSGVRGPCGGLQVGICPVGIPCVGSLVRRYAPWCKRS